MPWSRKQKKVARAVRGGWKAKGTAKGFGKDFAELVLTEGTKGKKKKGKR